jgi:hypothetical protein
MRKFIRGKAIDVLVEDAVETIAREGEWAWQIFRNGFPGFSSMSDEELVSCLNDAGLDDEFCWEEQEETTSTTD